MPDQKQDIKQALLDFNETIKAKPNLSDKELMIKFPEFKNDINLLQAAKDYSATLESGKYKTDIELDSKFPEFFDVKKKELSVSKSLPTQSPLQSPLESGSKIVGGGVLKEVSKGIPQSIGDGISRDKKLSTWAAAKFNDLVDVIASTGQGLASMQEKRYNKGLESAMNLLGESEERKKKVKEDLYIKGSGEQVRAKVESALRSSKSSKEYEQELNAYDIMDGIQMSDIAGLLNSAPAQVANMIAAVPTMGANYYLQTVGESIEELEKTPEGAKMDEGSKLFYASTQGLVQMFLEKFAIDKILDKTGLGKTVKSAITKKVVNNFVSKGTKATAKQLEDAVFNEVAGIRKKIARNGVNAIFGATTEMLTEGTQSAVKDAVKLATNAIQGKQIFDERDIKKNFWKNVGNSMAGGAAFGTAFGGGASLMKNTNKAIRNEVAQTLKTEGLDKVLFNINNQVEQGNITPQEAEAAGIKAQQYAEIAGKIPETVPQEKKYDIIGGIEQRETIKGEIESLKEDINSTDEAFRQPKQDQLDLLEGKLGQVNDYIESLVSGVEPRYEQKDGKFYKVIADGRQMQRIEIPENHYIAGKLVEEGKKQQSKTESDAVQEQTAGEVPVQSETTVSEEVEGGKPKTELEETTVIEGDEEKVKPKVNTESLESGGIKYYISDNDGNQVGVAEVSTVDDKIIIDNIFVDEKNKRKGFAKSIIDKIIEDFKGRKYEYVDQDNNEFSIPYKIETGTIVSEEGQALSNAVKKKIEDFNRQQESTQSEISQPIELSTEITEEGAPVEEVKLKRQEAEPPTAEGGKKISTISGLTEEERLPLVEERRKKTSLTKKEELHNELSFLAESADKAKGNEKAKLKAEIRQKVRNLNAELGDEVYRYDGTSVRVKTKKKGLDIPVYKKVTRTQRDSSLGAIKDDSVLLFDRNPDFVSEYEKLAESPNITSLSVDAGNGKRMTEQQIEAALEDIADGIPSVAADNLLNALEEGFNKGYFDLRGKGIGDDSQTIQAMYDEFIGAEQEAVTQPMTEEELIKFLEEESKLESEEEIELLDNIENLITEYESEPTKTISKSEIPSTKAKSETTTPERPEPNKSREGEGKPKTKVSGQPDEKAEGEAKPKSVEKKVGKFEAKAREIAKKIEESELPDWLKVDDKDIKKQGASADELKKLLADAVIKMGKLLDEGVEFADALKQSVKDLVNAQGEENRSAIEKGFEKYYNSQLEEGGEERRFTKQMLGTEGLENKEKIAETLKYVKQKNAISIEEANKIIDEIGLDEAFILVQSDAEMNGGVRGVLAQMLISRYNNLARTAKSKADKDFYFDKTIEVANFVTKKLATESGRIIQSFSIWSKLSPEALIRSAAKDMERQGELAKKKAKSDVDKIGNKLKKANEEAIDEVLESEEFKGESNKAETRSKSKAEAKIKAAKEKRKNIINKYKGKGGITFTSGGITKEGIEFIGEMAKTYIEEGIANIELIVEKIAENIKEVSGKDASDEVLAEVRKIADKKLSASDTKLIGAGLRDMNVKIRDVVKKHFIEAELVKEQLADKLVKEAGLSGEDATELANKVKAAFDRVATKKKEKILKDEIERLERAKNKLNGTKEVKTRELYDDIIKLTNLGGFENEQLLDLLANRVGTGKLTREQGERLQFLAQKVQQAPQGSPKNEAIQELFNYQANLKGTSKGEVGQAIWYASLLAGYKTHIKNIVANVFNTVGETVVSGVENPKAASAMIRGLFKGYQRGLIEAMHTLRTGKSPINITKIEASDVLERTSFKGGAKNPFNWLKYVSRFMVASDVFAFQGLKESRAYQMAYMEAAKMKKADAVLKDMSIWKIINEKLLDTPARKKEAELRVKAEGQVGVEAKRRMYELMEQSRPEKMQDDTYSYAARGTFNYQPEGTLGAINNALAYVLDLPIGGVKPLRFVVPFTRILTNVANNALDYEPIVGTYRAIRGKRGFESFETMTPTKGTFREMTPEERKRQFIKAGVGITALATLYALSKLTGDDDEPILEITGSGSQDYVKTNQLKERGWKPYSIKIGDTYYSYELTPLLLTLGYIGNLNDFEKYDAKSDSEVIEKMSQTAFRMQDAVSNMIFIGTLADFMDVGWDNTKSRGQKMAKYLENLAKTSVPFMQPITQISQGIQEIMELPKKETTKMGYSLIKDIPIARNALFNKINVLGEEIPTKSGLIVSKKVTNETWDFLENNRIFLVPINRKTVIGYDAANGRDVRATDEQFYNFSKMRGQMIKSVIESIKKNDGLTVLVNGVAVKKSWKELNTGKYKDEVDAFLEKKTAEATEKAKEIIFTQKPENYDIETEKAIRDIDNTGIGEFE